MKNTAYWDLANTSYTHHIVVVAPIQNPSDQVEECPEEGSALYSLCLTESEVGRSNSCNLLSLGDDGSFGGDSNDDLFDNLSAEDVIILPDEPVRQRSTVYPDIPTPPTEYDKRYLDQGEQSLQDLRKEGGCLQKTSKCQTGGFLQVLKEKYLFSGKKQATDLEERPQTTIDNVRSQMAHQFHGEMFCQVKRSHGFPALDKLAEDKFHGLGNVQCYSTTCWHEDSSLSDTEDEWQHDSLAETTSVQTWSAYGVSTASSSPGAPHLTHQMADDTRSLAPPSPDWPLFLTWDPRSPLAGRSLISLVDISDLVVPFSGEDNRSLASANPVEDSCLKPCSDTFLNNLAKNQSQAYGREMATTQEEKGNKEVKQGISSQQENEYSEVQVAQKKGKKSLRKRFLQWMQRKLRRKLA